MNNGYIKAVLTVIAAALVLLAWSSVVPASAQRGGIIRCDGKLLPTQAFGAIELTENRVALTGTIVHPMYDVSIRCTELP